MKAFSSFSREIIKIMSGALSTKGRKEGRMRQTRRDADYQVDLGRDPGNIPHTHARRETGRTDGRVSERERLGLALAAPFSDALIFIGGAEGAISYYDRE